ncbi:MAG: hypothetical protein ACTSRP_26400 [Candidatus Helarchaeota archaeon]
MVVIVVRFIIAGITNNSKIFTNNAVFMRWASCSVAGIGNNTEKFNIFTCFAFIRIIFDSHVNLY